MSGYLGPVAQKVVNLLGMTALGQKTKATALGVTLASDEDALAVTAAQLPAALGQGTMAQSMTVAVASNQSAVPVSVAAGSDVTEGNTSDAAVETDTTGTVSGKLRGLVKLAVNFLSRFPAALGQGTMAQSTPVAIASNQSAVTVADGAGSLTVDSTQLPASLGQGTEAQSMTVVLASDKTPNVQTRSHKNWFSVTARNPGGAYTGGDPDLIALVEVARTATAVDPSATTKLSADATIIDYFDGSDATFDDQYIWLYIPMYMPKGSYSTAVDSYNRFFIDIKNELGVSVDVATFGVAELGDINPAGKAVSQDLGSFPISAATVTTGTSHKTGSGGTTFTNSSNWPMRYLLVRVKPASDPAAGYWNLVCVLET